MYNLSFKSFLTEQILTEEIGNDSRGKLHELLFAKHLHPDKKMPTHFRNKHGSSPQEVHDHLKAAHPEHYSKIDLHSKKSAEHVIEHLHSHGLIPKGHVIHSVSWTSNRDTEKSAGDHEKLTGKKDIHSNADVMVTHYHPKTNKKGHIGISLKYGAAKNPNLKGPGMKDLERISGDNGLMDHHNHGQAQIQKALGGKTQKHTKEIFKKHAASSTPTAKAAVEKARGVAKKTTSHVAKRIADGMAKHSQPTLLHHIQHLTASHDNVHPHIRVSTHPDTGDVKVAHPKDDFNAMKKRYKHFRVRKHDGKSNIVHIEGVRHDGKAESAVQIGLKNVSSPASGMQAIVRASGMSKKDE